jgi:ferredoxin
VLDGEVAPPDGRERALLVKLEAGSTERVACQARVLGPVTISTGYW